MAAPLNWGIVATGKIAHEFTRGVAHTQSGRVVAVASRAQTSADAFASEHAVPRAHGSYAALLADRDAKAAR